MNELYDNKKLTESIITPYLNEDIIYDVPTVDEKINKKLEELNEANAKENKKVKFISVASFIVSCLTLITSIVGVIVSIA